MNTKYIEYEIRIYMNTKIRQTNVVFCLFLLRNTYTHWFLVHIYMYVYIYIYIYIYIYQKWYKIHDSNKFTETVETSRENLPSCKLLFIKWHVPFLVVSKRPVTDLYVRLKSYECARVWMGVRTYVYLGVCVYFLTLHKSCAENILDQEEASNLQLHLLLSHDSSSLLEAILLTCML